MFLLDTLVDVLERSFDGDFNDVSIVVFFADSTFARCFDIFDILSSNDNSDVESDFSSDVDHNVLVGVLSYLSPYDIPDDPLGARPDDPLGAPPDEHIGTDIGVDNSVCIASNAIITSLVRRVKIWSDVSIS